MKIRPLWIVAMSLAVAACSPATRAMEELVGRDIADAAVRYGPPSASFSMPDGRQAFQWRMRQGIPIPATTTSTITGTAAFATIASTTTGGGIMTQECVYTLYAEKSGRDRWTVVGFEPPSLLCD